MGIKAIGVMAMLMTTTGGVWALQSARLGSDGPTSVTVPTAPDRVEVNFLLSQCQPGTEISKTTSETEVRVRHPNTLAYADILAAAISMATATPVNEAPAIVPNTLPSAEKSKPTVDPIVVSPSIIFLN